MAVKRESNNCEPVVVAHGGRVFEAARRWGVAPEEVVDFSANINPFGPPPGVVTATEKSLAPVDLRSYPDSHAFISALAEKHGVASAEIVVGPGAAALIFAALRAVHPATALVM